VLTHASRSRLASSASWRAHRINVLIFFVWMSYRRATAALICAFDARVSTMKTCETTSHVDSAITHATARPEDLTIKLAM